MRFPTRSASAVVAATVAGLVVSALPAQAASRIRQGHHKTTTKTTTSTTTTTTTTTTAPTAAGSGQTTVGGLLPASALSFATSATGWTSYAGGLAAQIPTVGASASGALAATFAGGWTGVTSPSFAATPGARYSATGKVRAATTGHSVGLALRFLDANGAVIAAGTQVAQGLTDSADGWSATAPLIGFAPSGAVTGQVLFLGYDAPAGEVHYLDDVNVTKTTGVAARLAAPLRTSGRNILDANGHRVVFRGIDVNGLQYAANANVSTAEIAAAQQWGANFIRLPLAENYVLPGDCSYDSGYLSRVDQLVDAATSRGMFIMLDLHTNAVVNCAAPAQQKMPDANSVTWWKTIAAHYRSNPLVGFDLYNEPHDISDSVWRNGGTVSSGGATYSAPGMQTLYNTVRGTGATNLVFASGTNWATAFPTTAPLTGTTNLVYAAHAYTCPSGTPDSGANCTSGPNGVLDPSTLLGHFDAIGTTMPVVVTEFGWPSRYESRYISNLIAYVDSHDWSGWDVYAFDGSTSGLFDLVKDTGPLNDPAISGMAVMANMLST